MTGNVRWLNWVCRIVNKFFKIHWRHIKCFHDVKLLSLSAKSTFNIMNLGGYVFRIVFVKLLTTTINTVKLYSKLIRCLGTYFLKEIANKSMLESIISFSSLHWISYFLWIYSQISTNSSNVVFSIKIPDNFCE